MAERKKTIRIPSGEEVVGSLVDIVESIERFNEVRLGDGTVLKVKIVTTEVTRIDDRWDDEGNPMYAIKSHNVVVVSEAPETVKRKVQVQ